MRYDIITVHAPSKGYADGDYFIFDLAPPNNDAYCGMYDWGLLADHYSMHGWSGSPQGRVMSYTEYVSKYPLPDFVTNLNDFHGR